MKSLSKNYLNLILSMGFGIALAFFWALDRTLAYVLFGSACFFLVLFFYNRFALIDEHSGNYDKSESQQDTQGHNAFRINKTSSKAELPTVAPPIRNLKGTAVAAVVIALLVVPAAFFYFIRNTASSQVDLNPYDAYTKAEQFYALQQYDSANYYYQYACNNDEYFYEAWLGMGNIQYMRSHYDSALYFYEIASQKDIEAFQPKYNIAWWYYSQKQYQQSIDKISEFQSNFQEQADMWQLLGDNYYELSNHEQALAYYEKAYKIGNRSRWLCHVTAYLYDKNGNTQRAIKLYKEALTYDDNLVEIHTRLGELLPGTEGEQYRIRAAELQLSKER